MATPSLDPITALAQAKGISRLEAEAVTRSTIQSALVKKFGPTIEAEIHLTPEIRITRLQRVVETVTDPVREISLEEAQETDPDFAINDILERPVALSEFGRYAVGAAKQKIRATSKSSERAQIRQVWSTRTGDLVTATVMSKTGPIYQLRVQDVPAEVMLSEREAIQEYRIGDIFEAVLLAVEDTQEGPRLILSQTAAEYVTALFARHSDAVRQDRVRVVRSGREYGILTKIVVENTIQGEHDPVALYIGTGGRAASMVERELGSERLEIIALASDPIVMVRRAMEPANLVSVSLDPDGRTVHATVAQSDMGLAMGRKKSNVRLASRVTDLHIILTAERTQAAPPATPRVEKSAPAPDPMAHTSVDMDNPLLSDLGLSPHLTSRMALLGYVRLDDILDIDDADLGRQGLPPADVADVMRLLDDVAPQEE